MKNKAERYDWAKPGDHGNLCRLPITDLRIDPSYQRKELPNIIRKIASEFDWQFFGCVIVMKRKDGSKYVVDGQQRLAAAKKREDVSEVPCLVFISDGKEHEAKAFLALNTYRKNVSAIEKFNAAVAAGEQPELSINSWLKSVGLYITTSGQSKNGVCFPAHLKRTWMADSKACTEAILIQREVNGQESLNHACHNGIFWLLTKGVDVNSDIFKFKMFGGKAAMLREINAMEIRTGQRANNNLAGQALLKIINWKRRSRKIIIQDSSED